jgi:guanylate kinase
MMPPSFEELTARLRGRGSESEEQIAKRLEICRRECEKSSEYDYIVFNREVKKTASEIEGIILKNLKKRALRQ